MTRHPDLPTNEHAAAINAGFLAGRVSETGWRDDLGRPAPWPDDHDEWRPSTSEPLTTEPGQQPF